MKEDEPYLPKNHSFLRYPLQVYDVRKDTYLKQEEEKLQELNARFRIQFNSVAIKPTNKQLVRPHIESDWHINIWLNEETYTHLETSDSLLNHAYTQVFNTKRDRYGLQGVSHTGYDALDGILDAYKTFFDALTHRATFGKASHTGYTNITSAQAINCTNQEELTSEQARTRRAAYIDTYISRQHCLRTNQGIQQSAELLTDAFRGLMYERNISPKEKLHFFEYLADLEKNAISLPRSYEEKALRPPKTPQITDVKKAPKQLRKLANNVEDNLLELLSNYHTTKRLNAKTNKTPP